MDESTTNNNTENKPEENNMDNNKEQVTETAENKTETIVRIRPLEERMKPESKDEERLADYLGNPSGNNIPEAVMDKVRNTNKSVHGAMEYIFMKAQEAAGSGARSFFAPDEMVYGWLKDYFLDDSASYEPPPPETEEEKKAREEEEKKRAEETEKRLAELRADKDKAEAEHKKAEFERKSKIKIGETTYTQTDLFGMP